MAVTSENMADTLLLYIHLNIDDKAHHRCVCCQLTALDTVVVVAVCAVVSVSLHGTFAIVRVVHPSDRFFVIHFVLHQSIWQK